MKQYTVLIIDDNQDDILITERALSKIGRDIKTEVAMSGDESLALLRDERPLPSLILLDLKMVGMDGIEVLRRIRGDSALTGIPVVIVTHSALESDRNDAYRAGATEFLQKSVAIDQFSEDLRCLLERRMVLN